MSYPNGHFPYRIPAGAVVECADCCRKCCDDVFTWELDGLRTIVVCGDCRYYRRHGRTAPCGQSRRDTPHRSERETFRGSETLNRFQEFECPTERGAQELGSILDDCRLSID